MSRSSHSRAEMPMPRGGKGVSSSRTVARAAIRWMHDAWHWAARAARLAIGIPDYESYVAHMRERHAGQRPMDRAAFMRERMQARYGRGRARCC
jgi:uncharacterized short protein YbdD (DUF466 family)